MNCIYNLTKKSVLSTDFFPDIPITRHLSLVSSYSLLFRCYLSVDACRSFLVTRNLVTGSGHLLLFSVRHVKMNRREEVDL